MKTLRWFVGGSLAKAAEGLSGAGMGQSYVLDADYFPRALRLYQTEAPQGSAVVYDILDDGVSIFADKPQMDAGAKAKDEDTFNVTGEVMMAKDSVVTLSLVSGGVKGVGRDLTVELDLEEI